MHIKVLRLVEFLIRNISQKSLGHKTINSTKQYISLDSRNLKECALNFDGIAVGGYGL